MKPATSKGDKQALTGSKYVTLGDYGTTKTVQHLDPANCLKDGRSQIDMVLAYEISKEDQELLDLELPDDNDDDGEDDGDEVDQGGAEAEGAARGEGGAGDEGGEGGDLGAAEPPAAKLLPSVSDKQLAKRAELLKKQRHRNKYLRNVQVKARLLLEPTVVEAKSRYIYYIKVHVPWGVMCRSAEDMQLKVPLQEASSPRKENYSDELIRKIGLPNFMAQEVPQRPPDYHTAAFKTSKLKRYMGHQHRHTFFKLTDRQLVAYDLLMSTAYGKKKKGQIGIERLIDEGVFTAAYPLHEGPDEAPKGTSPDDMTMRQILYRYWGRFGCWYKYQPLEHVRAYFGEKIGLYFAWLGFYTAWLLPVSLVGLIIFIVSVLVGPYTKYVEEVCSSNMSYKICPACPICTYFYLSDWCSSTSIGSIFDNTGSVLMAVIMSLWAVTFLEFWKRTNVSLAYHWDVLGYEEEEERPRPQYQALAPTFRANPITDIEEPYFPDEARLPRILTSISTIIIMVIIVFIFIIAVVIYRVIFTSIAYASGNPLLAAQASTVGSATSAVLNLILIMVMGRVYTVLAEKLTDWEMHRTQTEYEDNLTLKVFVFQFFNFYGSLFYVGFFKGKFTGYPGNYGTMLDVRMEACAEGGCMFELAQQLLIIMVGKQVLNNIQEVVLPMVKNCLQRRRLESASKRQEASWERDYKLADFEGLMDEYLEMVIQFGFITIFVSAFPLAPLCALLNNWFEIRIDGGKMISEVRRPLPEKAEDIGVWYTILDVICQVAVITNAFLIAFTSQFLSQTLYLYDTGTMEGYVNFSLAWAPNGTTSEPCRYQDFRHEDGSPTSFYWKLMTVRLAFVVVFEHVIFFISRLIDLIIPDIPEVLDLKIKREQYMAKQALTDSEALEKVDEEEANLQLSGVQKRS